MPLSTLGHCPHPRGLAGEWHGGGSCTWPGTCCRLRSVVWPMRGFDGNESLRSDFDLVGKTS